MSELNLGGYRDQPRHEEPRGRRIGTRGSQIALGEGPEAQEMYHNLVHRANRIVAVYDGQDRVGVVIEVGGAHLAFDVAGTFAGSHATMKIAVRALPAAREVTRD